MHDLFLIHNLFRQSRARFIREDPQLKKLKGLPHVYQSPLIESLALAQPGVYTLSGGRQVGKTTLVKQVIMQLTGDARVPPENILYMTGEVLETTTSLLEHIQAFLDSTGIGSRTFLFIDEVTYINSWHRAIKFLADSGQLENTTVILTGSDMLFLKDTVKMLPGRRGPAAKTDFHYYPLSFREYLSLKRTIPNDVLIKIASGTSLPPDKGKTLMKLYGELGCYLETGGFLTAINDYQKNGTVAASVYKIYTDWIRGDVLRRNKQENYLEEILGAVIKRSGSQVSWNTLSNDLSIDHHKTVADYMEILASMDAVFIQSALKEDKLAGAPKKAKKLHFTDPFITRSLCHSLGLPLPEESIMIESAVAGHVKRKFPTYYIKAKGEIDIAYIDSGSIMPVEVKWTTNLRPEHLKLLKRYKNAVLGAKVMKESDFKSVRIIPIPVLLIRFS